MPCLPTRSRAAVSLIVLTVSALSSCFTTQAIRPADLGSLDGFESSDPGRAQRPVQTLGGGTTTYQQDATLALYLADARLGGRFTSIAVRDGRFQGRTTDGRTVEAPVDQIRAADISEHDVKSTALWVVIGGVLVAASVGLFFSLRTQSGEVSGRALRIDGRVVLACPANDAAGWRAEAMAPMTADLSTEARRVLAATWSENARFEHASVPAFSRLSLTLMSLGAPARLVEAAHRAALEEIEHARVTFALAGAYAGTPIAPGGLGELTTAPAVTATSLEALASESLVDGCFLEGIAAAAAAEALCRTHDPAVHAALTLIARDERGHAELAWRIVSWCCAEGGPLLRRHVRKLADRLPTAVGPHDAPAGLHAELAAHGWLAPEAWREICRRTRLDVAARAAALLAVSPDDPRLRVV